MEKKKTIKYEDEKDIISKLVSEILTAKFPKTPSELATQYIQHKKEGTPAQFLVAKSSSIAQLALGCKKAAGKRKSAAYEFFYKLWLETFEKMVSRLSKETLSMLRKNYDTPTLQKIISALIDFEGPIEAQKTLEKILQRTAEPKQVQKARLELKASETLLESNALTVPEQKTIERINRKYKDILGNVREVSVDTMKLTALYQIKNAIPETKSISIAEYVSNFPKIEKDAIERQQWHSSWHSELGRIIFNQGQGRPSRVYFNAIQMILYSLLAHESKPKTIRRYKAWCVRLTANIINEAYKHLSLPLLTLKKVEKVVHGG